MNPRIEPTLGPASPADAGLRADPAQRPRVREARAEGERPRRKARPFSVFGFLFKLLLLLIVLPPLAILALRWLPPPTTSYMLQSPTRPVQYHWVPAAQIADNMRRAVVASEDQKFWTHHGFDLEAIAKAEEYNRNARHHRRGASTISQQTAKNLFLWPGGYVRKGIEAGLTVLLEKMWGKPRILEMYLNVAEFGPGIYGVEAAAQNYFHKPASQLNVEEAARLAAVLPNPRRWGVRNPGPYVQARAAWIMGQMGYGSRNTPAQEPVPPADQMPSDEDDLPKATTAPPPLDLPNNVPVNEEQEPAAPAQEAAPAAQPEAQPATEPANPPPPPQPQQAPAPN